MKRNGAFQQKQIKENGFPPESILSEAEWAGMTEKQKLN